MIQRDWVNPATQAGARGPYRTANESVIARMRRAKGLTQPQAAKLCGVPLRTYQRAESGDVVPTAVKRKVERALGAGW